MYSVRACVTYDEYLVDSLDAGMAGRVMYVNGAVSI